MGLQDYRRKRDFRKTPEPSGGEAVESPTGRSFVIQKHAARRLHYDFRLELDGVLLSWAVPKGPSLDPGEKRLAVHVEDHPLEYGDFEGVIPEGQYGGGTVMVWDRGTWEPIGDARRDYRRGRLEFRLEGERTRGDYALVRMSGRDGDGDGDGKNWLLIKKSGEGVRRGKAGELSRRFSTSVATGRSMDAIAGDRDRVWDGERGEVGGASEAAVSKGRREETAAVPGRRSRVPGSVSPELATLVDAAPEGDAWLHEIKVDGYRLLAHVEHGKARLVTRSGKDWTSKFPSLARALGSLPAAAALLDGEVVAFRSDGTTDFQELQTRLGDGRESELSFIAFDLLHLDGKDLRKEPLVDRKEALRGLLLGEDGDRIRFSDHVRGHGGRFFEKACRAGVEGIVSKRADSRYVEKRSRDWLKVRCKKGQEVVVVGFTDPAGSRRGLGALVVGVHGEDGGLRFAGKVGTGFTSETLLDLRERLDHLERKTPPVSNPPSGAGARGIHWVKPELVAEVGFTEWTRDGRLRHPVFRGLRADKPAGEVVRETPKPSNPATAADEGPAGVRLTHPDRVVYPEQGVTKRELADYYALVADRMLVHVAGRPLTLLRCPSGRHKTCFFQKHAPEGADPALVQVVVNPGEEPYLSVASAEGLVALVQIGVLEVHVWGSRTDDLERPDRLVFDLDPDADLPWPKTVEMTLLVRDRLEALGLRSFAQTTGGKGLHVVVPLVRRAGWDEVKEFAGAFARSIAAERSGDAVAVASKARRKGKVFLDWLRNARGATAIAPFSTRARPGAPVAMPLAWVEVGGRIRSDRWNVRNAAERLESLREDPWEGYGGLRQSITRTMRRALGLE